MADVYGVPRRRHGARRPVLRPDRAGHLPDLRHRPQARAALERLRARRCSRSASCRCSCSTRCSGCRAACRSTRPIGRASRRWGSFNAAVSFVTNTNWQWFSGEVAMSHLTQMLGLTVQNFVSAAAGMAVVDRADPWHHPHRHAQPRQLLGRPDPHVVRILLPLALVVRRGADVAGRRPEPAAATRSATTIDAVDRGHRAGTSPAARSPRRRRSRSSARTAAASTTPTRRIRSRTRTGSPTSWRSSRSC